MLNILKDPKKISHIFSTVWIMIFDKRKGSYIFSTVWIPIFDKRKGSYIFSTVWIPIFDKVKTGVIYLFYFIMPISITCYSIIMEVVRVIEAAE